jgi:hypothetical protein
LNSQMIQGAKASALHPCPVCGGLVPPGGLCDYDRPEASSPALGDYAAMHRGLMTHAEHVVVVARWTMHNPQSQGPAVLERFRPVVREAWGKPQALFPLEA